MKPFKGAIWVLIILSCQLCKAQRFNLSRDLKNDYQILKTARYYIEGNMNGKSGYRSLTEVSADFKMFRTIVKTDLSTFKFSQVTHGYFTLFKWQKSSGKIWAIYQLSVAMPVDTVFEQNSINSAGPKEKFHVKTTINYSAYKIELAGENGTITYLTQKGQGLENYSIDNKKIEIAYESVVLQPASVSPKLREAIIRMIPGWKFTPYLVDK